MGVFGIDEADGRQVQPLGSIRLRFSERGGECCFQPCCAVLKLTFLQDFDEDFKKSVYPQMLPT